MPWHFEDWNDLLTESREDGRAEPEYARALREILARIPIGPEDAVAELLSEDGSPATSIVDRDELRAVPTTFARLSCAASGRFDLVVACDAIPWITGGSLTELLRGVRASLVEGGIFLATVPATDTRGELVAVPLASGTPDERSRPLHEVELQYRLRGAGFEGIRIRRFAGSAGSAARLVCMAVRRASN